MKVNMNIEESSKGLVFSKKIYNLVVAVALDEAELAAIRQAGVKDHILYMDPPVDNKQANINAEIWPEHDGKRPFLVNQLMKGKPVTFSYSTIQDAQQGMEDFKDSLRKLKGAIESVDAPRSDSFEL